MEGEFRVRLVEQLPKMETCYLPKAKCTSSHCAHALRTPDQLDAARARVFKALTRDGYKLSHTDDEGFQVYALTPKAAKAAGRKA